MPSGMFDFDELEEVDPCEDEIVDERRDLTGAHCSGRSKGTTVEVMSFYGCWLRFILNKPF